MFQLKNFVSIAASMLNYVRSTTGKVTDLQPGSVTRTILEAPAAEIEELYVQVFNGIKEAIPVAVYNSINFPKLPAKHASGRVTVLTTKALTSDLVVPKGTEFLSRDGRIYKSVAEQTWPAKDSYGNDVLSFTFPVVSLNPGVTQNAAAGEINASNFFNPDDYTYASTDMTNGADLESDDARDVRFADYITSLSRGTEASLLYGARSANIKDAAGNITESVTRVSLTVSTGSVKVNIWGSNGAPSLALVQRVQQIELGYTDAQGNVIPGYAAAGIRCQVAAMATRPVDVKFTLEMFTGYTLTATVIQGVKDALDSFLYNVAAGEIVYIDDVANTALLVRGVKAATVDITQNFMCGTDEVLVGGNVQVTAKITVRRVDVKYTVTLTNGGAVSVGQVNDIITNLEHFLQGIQPGQSVTADQLANVAMTVQGIGNATVDLTTGLTRGINETLTVGNIDVVTK